MGKQQTLKKAHSILESEIAQALLNQADSLFPTNLNEAHDYVLDQLAFLLENDYEEEDWQDLYECLSELVFDCL